MKQFVRKPRKKHQTNSLKYKVINVLRINQSARKQNLHKNEIDIIKLTLLKSSKLLSWKKINRTINLSKTFQERIENIYYAFSTCGFKKNSVLKTDDFLNDILRYNKLDVFLNYINKKYEIK